MANRHIGFLAVKWKIYSIPFYFLILLVLKRVAQYFFKYLPDPIPFKAVKDKHYISHDELVNLWDALWANSWYFLFLMYLIFMALHRMGFVLVGMSLFKEYQRRYHYQILILILLAIPSVYFGFMKGWYLVVDEFIGGFHGRVLFGGKYANLEFSHPYRDERFWFSFWVSVASFLIMTITVSIVNGLPPIYKLKLMVQGKGWYQSFFKQGYGGSASWANFGQFEKMQGGHADVRDEYNEYGTILNYPFLGKSLIDDDPYPRAIVQKDDTHLITTGITGSGKSTTVLYTNLAMYKHKIIVFDPKGELAMNTFWRRYRTRFSGNHNNRSYSRIKKTLPVGRSIVLDPYNETRNKLEYEKFNPLLEIDLNDKRAIALLNAISDGCVMKSSNEKDIHWTEWAKNIIEAMIVHVLSKFPRVNHNLPFILDLLTGKETIPFDEDDVSDKLDSFNELLIDMKLNDAFGGLPMQVATQLLSMGYEERGSVLSTTYRSLKWVGEPTMREQLSGCDTFYVQNTLYVVLPADMIAPQARWVRVVMGCFLVMEQEEVSRSERGKQPSVEKTLFIFDEFAQLGGNLEVITNGFPILRGYNIKLWLIVQNLSQLKTSFGERYNDIVGASTLQIFGINDLDTAKWVSERLGKRVNRIEQPATFDNKGKKQKRYVERIDPLLSVDEVENMLKKNKKTMIVFSPEGKPMRLERVTYKPIPGYNLVPFDLKGHFEDW